MNLVSLPQVEERIIVVSIPMTSSTINVKNREIYQVENFFISKRDKEMDHDKKVEFDRARALLKWAGCCSANLLGLRKENKKFKFSFGFSSMRDLIEFCDSLETNVDGATMR